MKIKNEWTTPIGKLNLVVSEELRKSLIQVVVDACARQTASKSLFDKDYNRNHETLLEFEKTFDDLIKYYLRNAYGVSNELIIDARAYGFNTISINRGGYNKPIRNHEGGFDGILVYCITPGGEYYLDEDNYPKTITNQDSYTSQYIIQNPLHIQDTGKKWDIYNMTKGDVLIYPSYCWGGSSPFTGNGIQTYLFVNYRTKEKNEKK